MPLSRTLLQRVSQEFRAAVSQQCAYLRQSQLGVGKNLKACKLILPKPWPLQDFFKLDFLLYEERNFSLPEKQHFLHKDLGFGVSSWTLTCSSWLPGEYSCISTLASYIIGFGVTHLSSFEQSGVSFPVHLIVLS